MPIKLVFTGRELQLSGGKRSMSYPARSGWPGVFEAIPAGNYWVNSDEIHELGYFSDFRNKLMSNLSSMFDKNAEDSGIEHAKAWGHFRIPIKRSDEQKKQTDRKGFFIHGGDNPFTAGCIELNHWMPAFVQHLKDECRSGKVKISLEVIPNKY